MESHDQSHLLLCNKEDLVKYIMKLKQNEEGIMDFKVRGAGLGCNSYEKFINLSAELDYSEDLITQTTTEANRVIKKLKEDFNKKLDAGTEQRFAEMAKINVYHKKIKEEMDELKEKIICLESDSYNEVSLTEYEELEEENESLKKTCLKWQEKADFNLTDSDDEEDERMVDWKAGEFCCVDYKFRGKCCVCNEYGRWVAVDKDDDGKDEPVMCCYGCDTEIDEEGDEE